MMGFQGRNFPADQCARLAKPLFWECLNLEQIEQSIKAQCRRPGWAVPTGSTYGTGRIERR